MITFAMRFITWLYDAHIVAESVSRDHTQVDDQYFADKTPSQHQMKQHRKRHHFPILSWNDFLIFWCFSLLLVLLCPSHSRSGLHPAFEQRYRAGPCVWGVSACLSGSIEKKGSCRCEARIQVTPPSAGPWSPGPPGEWWRWFSPTPLSAAPGGRPPLSPGPSSPRMVGSGSFLCPPTLSYSGSAACPDGKEDRGKKLVFEDGHKICDEFFWWTYFTSHSLFTCLP